MFYKLFIAAIVLSVNINAQVIIKNIIVVGNTKTDVTIIKKNCAFYEGEELTRDQIADNIKTTKQNLDNTFYFENELH